MADNNDFGFMFKMMDAVDGEVELVNPDYFKDYHARDTFLVDLGKFTDHIDNEMSRYMKSDGKSQTFWQQKAFCWDLFYKSTASWLDEERPYLDEFGGLSIGADNEEPKTRLALAAEALKEAGWVLAEEFIAFTDPAAAFSAHINSVIQEEGGTVANDRITEIAEMVSNLFDYSEYDRSFPDTLSKNGGKDFTSAQTIVDEFKDQIFLEDYNAWVKKNKPPFLGS